MMVKLRGIPAITCIIPLFEDAYGYVLNIEEKYGIDEFECWISIKEYQLCLYLPAIIYVSFAAILLGFTYYKVTKTNDIRKTAAVSKRLTLYTIVFVITWLFPILLRLRGIITISEPHPWWVWAHHISLALIGTGNALIWSSSKTLKQAKDKHKLSNSKIKSKTKSRHKKSKLKSMPTASKSMNHTNRDTTDTNTKTIQTIATTTATATATATAIKNHKLTVTGVDDSATGASRDLSIIDDRTPTERQEQQIVHNFDLKDLADGSTGAVLDIPMASISTRKDSDSNGANNESNNDNDTIYRSPPTSQTRQIRGSHRSRGDLIHTRSITPLTVDGISSGGDGDPVSPQSDVDTDH